VPIRSHSLVELLTSIRRYVEAGLQGAVNTKCSYAADLCSFEDYCQRHQLCYLPAEVTTVAGYASQLADRGLKYTTIWRPSRSSMNMPHHIIYLSRATVSINEQQLQ
jgi:site-specific recombinase XerD